MHERIKALEDSLRKQQNLVKFQDSMIERQNRLMHERVKILEDSLQEEKKIREQITKSYGKAKLAMKAQGFKRSMKKRQYKNISFKDTQTMKGDWCDETQSNSQQGKEKATNKTLLENFISLITYGTDILQLYSQPQLIFTDLRIGKMLFNGTKTILGEERTERVFKFFEPVKNKVVPYFQTAYRFMNMKKFTLGKFIHVVKPMKKLK